MSNKIMEAKTYEELITAVADALNLDEKQKTILTEKYIAACKAYNLVDDEGDVIDPMSTVSEEEMKAEERNANKIMTAFRFTYPEDTKTMIELYNENPDLVLSAFSAIIKIINNLKG